MKKMLMSAVAVAAFAAAFAAEDACKDGMCPLPASPAEAEFAVLSPVPETAVETARNPLGSRAYANYYGNPGSAFDPATCPLARQEAAIAEAEGAKETATPPWLEWTGLKSMKTVPAMQDGKNIFLVTGDPARNKEQCVPGGGSATVKIVLPAKWDALMAEKGYEPLEKFTLKSDMRPDVPKPKVRGYDRPGVRADVGPGMRRRPQGGRGPRMRRRPSSDE